MAGNSKGESSINDTWNLQKHNIKGQVGGLRNKNNNNKKSPTTLLLPSGYHRKENTLDSFYPQTYTEHLLWVKNYVRHLIHIAINKIDNGLSLYEAYRGQ